MDRQDNEKTSKKKERERESFYTHDDDDQMDDWLGKNDRIYSKSLLIEFLYIV